MPSYIAFLRAINVAGRYIKKAQLASSFEELGHTNVSTYINSGNVLFTARSRTPAKLAASLEKDLEPLLGFRAEVFVRTPAQVSDIVLRAGREFPDVPAGGEINVAFLAEPLSTDQATVLESLRTPVDEFAHQGPQVIWLCRVKQSESKVSNALLERRLRVRTTIRRVRMLRELPSAP